MKKFQIVLLVAALGSLSTGCIASRKYVRNEVKTSSDNLSGQLDKTNGDLKETRDGVDRVNKKVDAVDQKVDVVDQKVAGVDQKVAGVDQRVNTVDGKVTDLDGRTIQLKGDVNAIGNKTDLTTKDLAMLDQKFKSRNNFQVQAQKSVSFKFDSADLPQNGQSPLDEIASALKENPDALIVLEGHTDSTGDATYNLKLGERRVDAVRRYLAIEKDVPVYKIEQISFGSDRPIAPNNSRDGREKNRSVTIMLLVPSMANATASVTP